MSSESAIIKRLRESKDNDEQVYTIRCWDQEGSILNILNALKALGEAGHSCNIIIDPNSENETRIFFDGDGTDKIYNIEVS